MAAVTVAWDGLGTIGRVNAAETITGWAATGGGITETQETEFFYQGSYCISCKIKTAEASLYYTSGSTNMSTNNSVWIGKIQQTNKNGIDGNGMQLRIGTGTGAYYRYDVANSTTYPVRGGFLIIPINPGISQWYDATIGSPGGITAITYWAGASDSAATAKAENFGIDAIDVIDTGEGLTLTRGDSTDANGTFQDFVDEDEGTSTNRWGHVYTQEGIIYVTGVLSIGNSTTNTEFTDSNKVLVFPDGRVSNGFFGVNWAINNTSTIDISACIFNGRGALYTSDDTRPTYQALGTAGTLTVTDSTFNTYADIILTSNCTFDGCSFLAGKYVEANTANVYQCTITDAATAPGEPAIFTDNVTRIVECNFTQGANGGHAVQCNTAGTYTWSGLLSGYDSSNGQTNSAFYNNSGGLITLNLQAGADTPSVRNGTSATTDIVSSATITITNIITESEIRLINSNNFRDVYAGNESVNGFVQSATVSTGGSGYDNADILTVTGGTGTAATLNITTDGSGVIVSAGITSNGEYSVDPTNPVSHTGGSGTGAEFNLDIKGEFEYTYGGSPTADIIVFHLDYKDVRFSNYTLPSSDSGLFISQTIDRVYFNP